MLSKDITGLLLDVTQPF